MFKEPITLIDETISNLETLQAIFEEEFDSLTHSVDTVNVNGAICRQAHFKIAALLPVLRAARQTQEMPPSNVSNARAAGHPPHCLNCD
jgi:hypothetical protein